MGDRVRQEKLVGTERTKQLFGGGSLNDPYELLHAYITSLELENLRRLRACSVEELLEVQAEARVLFKLKEKLTGMKSKDEKNSPKVMPSGM